MSLSNRDKVGRGLELLAAGMRPFVDRHMSAAVPGRDWVEVLRARDGAKHGQATPLSADDPRLLLRVVTENWRVFGDALSRVEQSYASELRQVGNDWAHNAPFSGDDTGRALDTMQRLLVATGAPTQAEQVGALRLAHQRQQYEDQTRRAARAAVDAVNVPGAGLKPWREVITPHRDVATGQFNAAEFAADLHQVATGQALQTEYSDPREFFARTYLTQGLSTLLAGAVRRLSGDTNASPVVNLQTNFGGGKTHSMLALYHLFGGTPATDLPQAVQDVVGGVRLQDLAVRRVALVGTHLSPSQPLPKDDGTVARTLWGELAWQLGGPAAFDAVANADATGTAPGEALARVIRAHAPVLILIDEWVAYARLLYGRDDLPGGSFENQFTFAQHLTEAIRAVPGALLVVSIPASDELAAEGGSSALEVGGTHGRAALEKLQHVVGRTADNWRPATAVESFEIVRRRLFEEPSAQARAEIAAVARRFVTFYRDSNGQFPRDVKDGAYEARIKAAYPIHPELFDRLYQDWSALEKFQRTRGVLRLMSKVIHALWTTGDAGPLIMPGSVPLNAPEVFSELTNYFGDNWKPIVDADIDGEGSTPVRIDASRPTFGARSLTRRIARTVFVGSAPTLGKAHKGLDRQRLWLGVAIPGDTIGNLGSAVEVLSQQATYFYEDSGRYWFDTQASVTRTAQDIADRLREEPELVWLHIKQRLTGIRRQPGGFAAVHVAPDTSADVPDRDETRLVVVHPRFTHAKHDPDSDAMRFARQTLATVGAGQRIRRNMLVFVAADRQRYEDLDAAVRDHLAWTQVAERTKELNLTAQQQAQAQARKNQSDETVAQRLDSTYMWALVPRQPVPSEPGTLEVEKISDGGGSLAERVTEKLRRGGDLASSYGAASIRLGLEGPLRATWEDGHLTVGTLWDYYTRYPYLDRLRSRSVLDAAVLGVLHDITWTTEGFALAQGVDESTGEYHGLAVPHTADTFPAVTDSTLLVPPAAATTQRERERSRLAELSSLPRQAAGGSGSGAPDHGLTPSSVATRTRAGHDLSSTAGESSNGTGPVSASVSTRFYGSKALSSQRYGRDFAQISQEILQHLAAVTGVKLTVTVDVVAETEEGFTQETMRVVSENAATLKFDTFEFERRHH